MSGQFKIDIVNPEKSFFTSEEAIEVIIPAYEGEMGILSDHISTISFLKPGILKVINKSSDDTFFIEDGIAEFKDNCLSILTSSIYNLNELTRVKAEEIIKAAEKELNEDTISDQNKYLLDQKIETLNSLNLN